MYVRVCASVCVMRVLSCVVCVFVCLLRVCSFHVCVHVCACVYNLSLCLCALMCVHHVYVCAHRMYGGYNSGVDADFWSLQLGVCVSVCEYVYVCVCVFTYVFV